MALPLAGILFIGLFPQTAVSAITPPRGFFIHHPADAADYLLSPTLAAVSRTAWLLILVVGLLAWLRSRALRTRQGGPTARRGAAGFTSPNVRMQYSRRILLRRTAVDRHVAHAEQRRRRRRRQRRDFSLPRTTSTYATRTASTNSSRHGGLDDCCVINKRAMRLRTGKINHYVLFALAFLVLIFLLSIFNLI